MTGIFVTLLCPDDFESDCLETKFQTITSSIQIEKGTDQKSIDDSYFQSKD